MKKSQSPLRQPVSADSARSSEGVLSNIGEALRSRRRQLHLSLAEVAERSELSIGYISQIERNLASPSLTALMRIGQVLGLELDYFFHARSAGGHHFPQSARTPFQLQASGMTFDRISGEFPSSVVNALVVTVPPGHRSSPVTHPGEELAYVISGNLQYTLGERKLHLSEGDSVHLPSDTPHCWENPFAKAATVLWVGTAPLFKAGSDDADTHEELQSHGSPTRRSSLPKAKAKAKPKATTQPQPKAQPKARPVTAAGKKKKTRP